MRTAFLPLLGAAAAAPTGRSYHAGLCQPPTESTDPCLLDPSVRPFDLKFNDVG